MAVCVKVHPFVLKHGVESPTPSRLPNATVDRALDDDGPPSRELRLGFDTSARLLEIIVVVFEDGAELVIHAMPRRKKYLDLLP